MRIVVAAVCSLLFVPVAVAQPVPEAPAVAPSVTAPPAPAPAATVSAAEPRNDAGWQLYHDAFDALMHGQRAHARDLATQLIRSYPDHPATRLVQAAALGAVPGQVDSGEPPEGPIVEKPTRAARAELALFQTLHGISVGIEVCLLADCDSAGAGFGLALAGAGAAAAVALNIDDLTSGQRALLNSGTVWGGVNAGLLLLATEPDGDKTVVGSLLAGQGLGLVIGAGLFGSHATAGQVALANSGGEWGLALSTLTLLAIQNDNFNRDGFLVMLAATDIGIATAAYLASRYPRVSRAQTLVLDAGGLVGGVAGGSLSILISGDAGDRGMYALAAAGAVVGLATSAYFTRHWGERDDSGSSVQTFVRPVEHARGGVAGLAFNW